MGQRSISRFTKTSITKLWLEFYLILYHSFSSNYSAYSWEQIKFHLQDKHDNASLNVQLLQKNL